MAPTKTLFGEHSASSIPDTGGPDMAKRIDAFDWSASPLGPRESWSSALSIALDLCLGSRMCSCIYWGTEHIVLYNDAYASILGTKHPWALGRPAAEVWPEILHIIGPLMLKTLEFGETTGDDDAPIFLNRSGYVEEFYCSFSYAPIRNGNDHIEGVFATLPETSERVIGERRLLTLQQLGVEAREVRSPVETLTVAADVLARNPRDLPFAALYLWEDDDHTARLQATANIEPDLPLTPLRILRDDKNLLARLLTAAEQEGIAAVRVEESLRPLPLGAWKIPARELIGVHLRPIEHGAPNALLIAGVNPHKRLDGAHVGFFRMLGDQLTRSLAIASTHAQQQARVDQLTQRNRAEQEAERVRIARDLHDTLLQSMQGMRFLLEVAIERQKTGTSNAMEMFENALKATEHAIEEGREVLSLLRASVPDSDRVDSALQRLCEEIAPGTETDIQVEVRGPERELASQTWHEVYGLCREALANAVRHAEARCIKVTLNRGDELQLSVLDDGRGIDPTVARHGRGGHYGIQGMRERAAAVGGTLDVVAGQPAGTEIALTIPGNKAYT